MKIEDLKIGMRLQKRGNQKLATIIKFEDDNYYCFIKYDGAVHNTTWYSTDVLDCFNLYVPDDCS